jgi:hypothetical protein
VRVYASGRGVLTDEVCAAEVLLLRGADFREEVVLDAAELLDVLQVAEVVQSGVALQGLALPETDSLV